MISRRSYTDDQRPTRLPDLPDIAFRDEVDRELQPRRPSSAARSVPTLPHRPEQSRAVHGRRTSNSISTLPYPTTSDIAVPARINLPSARQVVVQAIPNAGLAVTLLSVGWLQGLRSPAGMPLWAIIVLLPSLVTLALVDGTTNPHWYRTALVNLVTVGVVLPVLAVQRFVTPPTTLDDTPGPMLAPVLATTVAIGILVLLGIASAMLSREDPEYAGVLILPACLLVAACSGISRSQSLEGVLLVAGFVFLAAAVATVVASLLPGGLAALVAPVVLAVELLLLTVVGELPPFPTDLTQLNSLVAFTLLLTPALLTVSAPLVSDWCRRVEREVRRIELERTLER